MILIAVKSHPSTTQLVIKAAGPKDITLGGEAIAGFQLKSKIQSFIVILSNSPSRAVTAKDNPKSALPVLVSVNLQFINFKSEQRRPTPVAAERNPAAEPELSAISKLQFINCIFLNAQYSK